MSSEPQTSSERVRKNEETFANANEEIRARRGVRVRRGRALSLRMLESRLLLEPSPFGGAPYAKPKGLRSGRSGVRCIEADRDVRRCPFLLNDGVILRALNDGLDLGQHVPLRDDEPGRV